MGNRLIAEAYAFVSAFNERARAAGLRPLEPLEALVLQRMAFVALDSDRDPTYFAGRDATLVALGLPVTNAARQRLKRATSALIEAGAIARASTGYRGSTTVYRLIHEGESLVIPIVENRGSSEHPQTEKGDHETNERGSRDDVMGGLSRPPKEGRGYKEEGDARANDDFELTAPPAPTPTPWDFNLPQPQSEREAARCPEHPEGTTGRCYACGANRRAWAEAHSDAVSSRTRRKPSPSKWDCTAGRHRFLPDGTCMLCEVKQSASPTPIGAIA